jgi:5,10-methylenetetrahydromethanopterin reductase
MAEYAALAEQIGFDSVWVIDSQLLCRDVFVTLAAILARTSTLRAATGVTQPVTRHASVVAGAMASLAELSGGRAVLGVGSGFSSLGTIGLGQARVADVDTFIHTTRTLLSGREAAFDNGVTGRLAWVDRPAGVPVVIAASGPRVTRLGGRIADGVIIHQGLAPAAIARAVGWVAEGARQRDDQTRPEISCWAPYSLAPTRAEAYARVRARVAGALATARLEWFEGAERDAVARLKAAYDIADHANPAPGHAALVPDALIPGHALAGDAAEMRDNLARLLAHPDIDRVILTPQVTGPGARPLPEVLRAFETDILAHL